MNKVMALAVLSMIPAVGSAQVVTPVPEKSTPPAAWTPPPPVPVPPPVPQEPDVAAPNIVKRDAAGAIIWPDKPFELVVLEGVPMDPAQRTMWQEKWTARMAQQDDMILKNIPKAMQLHDAVANLENIPELGRLIALADPMKAVVVTPVLDTFVKTSQVLKPKQLAAFNEGVTHFKGEVVSDLNKDAGEDKNKLMIITSRKSILERSSEPMTALDRMAAALAENWAKTKGAMNLSGDFGAAEAMAAKASDAKSKAAAGIALLKVVPAERQAEVLGMFKTPMPAAPKPPVDPAKGGVQMPKAPPTKMPGTMPSTK